MSELIWSNAFTRSLRKLMQKRPAQTNDITEALRLLVEDPFVLQLETHKLKGKLGMQRRLRSAYRVRFC